MIPNPPFHVRLGVAALAASLFTSAASADCLPLADEILAIKVTECQTIASKMTRAREGMPQPFRDQLEFLKYEQGSLLLSGFVTRREIVLTDHELRAIPEPMSRTQIYQWEFAGTTKTCKDVIGSEIAVYRKPTCCDVKPTTLFACFFRVGKVTDIPPELSQ